MDNETLRVHDLLWISEHLQLFSREKPDWVCTALTRMPVVVVRRAETALNLIAVGVRGDGRERRHAAVLRLSAVGACRTPESLAGEQDWTRKSAQIPAHLVEALASVSEYCTRERLVWGPIGSVGYQLATKLPVTTATSDLDVMIRCQLPPHRDQMRNFEAHLRKAPIRVDVILEGPSGGVAMSEYLSGDEVLIKTGQGARIGPFVW
jgi:phosphoribosyl-dephospho-CoA transferase